MATKQLLFFKFFLQEIDSCSSSSSPLPSVTSVIKISFFVFDEKGLTSKAGFVCSEFSERLAKE
jgi:hypothetical protein